MSFICAISEEDNVPVKLRQKNEKIPKKDQSFSSLFALLQVLAHGKIDPIWGSLNLRQRGLAKSQREHLR